MTTALGLLAGLLTTGCWLPQLRRSWITRSTLDISWLYLVVLASGVGLWLIYGLVAGDVAIAVTNFATALALTALMLMKGRFDHDLGRRRRPADSSDALPD